MEQTVSSNWSIFSTELDPREFSPEIRRYASGVVSFLDRLDCYRPLLDGLPTYTPLIDAIDELRGEVDEAIDWLNDYLAGRLSYVTLSSNLKDNASAQLVDALEALSDFSLDLPARRQEEFLKFLYDDATDGNESEADQVEQCVPYLMDDAGCLSASGIDEDELINGEDVFPDAEVDAPFLHTINVLLNDTETLADRIVRDLRKHGHELNDVFVNARIVG